MSENVICVNSGKIIVKKHLDYPVKAAFSAEICIIFTIFLDKVLFLAYVFFYYARWEISVPCSLGAKNK